eukprot:gene2827-3444_t
MLPRQLLEMPTIYSQGITRRPSEERDQHRRSDVNEDEEDDEDQEPRRSSRRGHGSHGYRSKKTHRSAPSDERREGGASGVAAGDAEVRGLVKPEERSTYGDWSSATTEPRLRVKGNAHDSGNSMRRGSMSGSSAHRHSNSSSKRHRGKKTTEESGILEVEMRDTSDTNDSRARERKGEASGGSGSSHSSDFSNSLNILVHNVLDSTRRLPAVPPSVGSNHSSGGYGSSEGGAVDGITVGEGGGGESVDGMMAGFVEEVANNTVESKTMSDHYSRTNNSVGRTRSSEVLNLDQQGSLVNSERMERSNSYESSSKSSNKSGTNPSTCTTFPPSESESNSNSSLAVAMSAGSDKGYIQT